MPVLFPSWKSGWEDGFSPKPRRVLASLKAAQRPFDSKIVAREPCRPPRRNLASLSFPRSGSGFREAAVMGGRAACLPPPPTAVAAAKAPRFTSCLAGPPRRMSRRAGAWASAPPGAPSVRTWQPQELTPAAGLAERQACLPLGSRRRPGPGTPSPRTSGRGRRLSPKVGARGCDPDGAPTGGWSLPAPAGGAWQAGNLVILLHSSPDLRAVRWGAFWGLLSDLNSTRHSLLHLQWITDAS